MAAAPSVAMEAGKDQAQAHDGVERPADMAHCSGLSGSAEDSDPAGLNVRAGPSLKATVIAVAKLRAFARDALGRELLQAPEFSITGSRGGWLLVAGLRYPDPPVDPALPASGWVHGSRVLVRTYDDSRSDLHRRPTSDSPARAIGGMSFTVLGCTGRWIHVRATDGSSAGWLAAHDVCSEQMRLERPVNPCSRRAESQR